MRTRTLLTQVLAVNSLLVGMTAIVAVVVTRDQLGGAASSAEGLLLLALAVFSAVLLNSLLIRRRLEPMERLVQTMDQVDLNAPGMRASPPRWAAREVQKLTTGFNRMLSRIEDERRQAGRAVLRGQEQERSRIAQDLHDEVNQALTGILLRLEATTMDAPLALRPELQETKRLANQAMEELLQLARQLRPTALDDHGLIPALASQVEDFAQRTGIDARFSRHGDMPSLTDEEQLVIYRVTQESLSNIAQHAKRVARARAALLRRPHDPAHLRRRRRLRPRPGQRRPQRAAARPRRRPRPLRHARARAADRRQPRPVLRPWGRHHDRTHDGSNMKILIADDHGIVRGGLRLLIDRQPDMEVVAEAEDGIDAFEQALATKPDLCVMDVSMPRMTGLQAAREIRSHMPNTQVLVLSMHDDERYVFDALKAGASGYVLKREVDQALIGAMRAVHRGEAFLTTAVERSLIRDWMSDDRAGPDEPLTPREQEVLKLIAEAHTNKQIAEILHLAEKTVESHRANLLRKLGMRDRVELVRYAIRRGLTEARA